MSPVEIAGAENERRQALSEGAAVGYEKLDPLIRQNGLKSKVGFEVSFAGCE